MSMANSLEIREPFFDQDLVEFLMSVPDACVKVAGISEKPAGRIAESFPFAAG